MKPKNSIQLKAALLLIIFSMNTIISFACAVGINMGFNRHHDDETTFQKTSHHHDEADNDHHKSKGNKDNCCNDGVMKFTQLDKAIPHSFSVINPIFSTTFISAFNNNEILFPSQVKPGIKYFVRSYHPPIPDIRIAIQSFQI